MTKTPHLIGIIGPAGAGKSTTARELSRMYNYRISPMAGPLKRMLMSLGLTHDEVYGDAKETPINLLCGKTPRHAMQTLGTEWGRGHIGEDIWGAAWERQYLIDSSYANAQPVVVDDVRFDNEVERIRRLGGVIWEVRRLSKTFSTAHASEVRPVGEPDAVIENDYSTLALQQRIRVIMDRRG